MTENRLTPPVHGGGLRREVIVERRYVGERNAEMLIRSLLLAHDD